MADRFEREINEIIRKTGDLPPPPRAARRAVRRASRTGGRRIFSLNARSMMLVSLVLLLIGSLLWGASSGLGGLIVLIGIVLLLASYAVFFGNRNTTLPGGYEKRWRGQAVYDERSASPWSDRLRGFWSRLKR